MGKIVPGETNAYDAITKGTAVHVFQEGDVWVAVDTRGSVGQGETRVKALESLARVWRGWEIMERSGLGDPA